MKIDLKTFANPYLLFSISWTLCLFFYSLRWAEIYPALSISLMVFVVIAIVTNMFFGLILKKLTSIYSTISDKVFNMKYLMIMNAFFWLINFAYSGIPLLNLVLGKDFDHSKNFGLPSFAIFLLSFNSFLSLLTFYYYLKLRDKKYLYFFIINNLFLIMIVSRGTIMMTLLSSFFLWLFIQNKAISLKKIMGIIISVLIILYLFGVAGNYRTLSELRTSYGYEGEYNSKIILQIAQATPSFTNSVVPGEFMWSYVYFTSPLGNLQENINKASVNITLDNAIAYFVNEFTFDFISKRIQTDFNIKKYEEYRFTPELTVPTTFAEAYLYLGWWGIGIYLIAMLLLPVFYFLAVRKFPLWQLGMSVLCCIYFFSIFDNMFIFSGLSLQLFYPFVFFERVRK